jgi:ribosomal protein L9
MIRPQRLVELAKRQFYLDEDLAKLGEHPVGVDLERHIWERCHEIVG